MARTLFSSISAQPDNLGDIVIRRTALHVLVKDEHPAVLYAGKMPSSYIDAFGLGPSTRIITRAGSYQLLLLSRALQGKANLLFAPGPAVFVDSPRSVLRGLFFLVMAALVRAGGGNVLCLGRAFRGTGRTVRILERGLRKLASVYFVRDDVSSGVLGRKVEMLPDLAFHEGAVDRTPERKRVAISLRYDRQPCIASLKVLTHELKAQGFEPCFVSQVARDDAQHQELSKLLEIEAVLWLGTSHGEQLKRVEATYAEACLVVSNRLHALLIGAAQGAHPVQWFDGEADKIDTTLLPWLPEMGRLDPRDLTGPLAPSITESLFAGSEATKKDYRGATLRLTQALREIALAI